VSEFFCGRVYSNGRFFQLTYCVHVFPYVGGFPGGPFRICPAPRVPALPDVFGARNRDACGRGSVCCAGQRAVVAADEIAGGGFAAALVVAASCTEVAAETPAGPRLVAHFPPPFSMVRPYLPASDSCRPEILPKEHTESKVVFLIILKKIIQQKF
jgi:hypothetical protein